MYPSNVRCERSFACYHRSDYHMARWLSWLERRPVTAEVVGSNPIRVACFKQNYIWDLSSAGRASALQAEGHRFESYWSHLYARYLRYVYAAVAELADAQDLKSCGTYTPIRVRFPLPALNTKVFRKYV